MNLNRDNDDKYFYKCFYLKLALTVNIKFHISYVLYDSYVYF